MPEGHTLHRLARDIGRDLQGGAVGASSPQGRFAQGASQIDGRVLERTEAYGKHLFLEWESDLVLHVHLGLIGGFRRQPSPPALPQGLVRLRLEGADHTWDLSGPMVCRLGDPDLVEEVTATLGPDPLRADADPGAFAARVARSRKAIGALLLDQDVVAGVGNVYRAEVLFLCGIHPARAARSLAAAEVGCLWDTIAAQLRLGLRRNRIVTIDPADLGKPISGVRRGEGVYVYHQEHCARCGAPTEVIDLGGRRIWACPIEQPRA
jgi:endonuclease-8